MMTWALTRRAFPAMADVRALGDDLEGRRGSEDRQLVLTGTFHSKDSISNRAARIMVSHRDAGQVIIPLFAYVR